MICYPGEQQLQQKSACWNAGIERQTYLTPTALPLLPLSSPSAATTTPGTAHTSGWQIPNLASLKLMFFSTPLILICFQSPLSPSRLLPFIFSVFSLDLSPSVSLFLSHLLLRLETSNRTFGQPLSSWQVLK